MRFEGTFLLFLGLCCCSNVRQTTAFLSRSSLTKKVPSTSGQQGQQPPPQHAPDIASDKRRHSSSSCRLNAFGGSGGGFGNFNPNTNPPIRTRQDVLQRLQQMAMRTWQQSTSGLISGYILGSLWGLLRGPSLTVANRGVAWGSDFAVLSALFSTTESVTQFVLALPSKDKKEIKDDNDDNAHDIKRQKQALLWSVTIRNMILAIYFGRHGGIVKMIRSALLYGGLTYYFVSKKNKRDLVQFKSMNSSSVMMGNDPSSTMQQILQQMLANQSATTTTTTGTTPASKESSKKASNNVKPKAASINAVDVEWEKVENDDDDHGSDGTKGEKEGGRA